MLHAARLGVENEYALPPAETGDGLETVDTEVCVPENLGAALDALECDEALVSAVGELLVGNFIGIKRKEWDDFLGVTTGLGAVAVPGVHLARLRLGPTGQVRNRRLDSRERGVCLPSADNKTVIVYLRLGCASAFTLIAMGVGFGYYAYYQAGSIETIADAFDNQIFYLLNQNTYSVMENDTLVAVPLFLFMGYVVERANIVNFVPIFLPMLDAFDVNPYFFAMLIALNLQTSFLTPPMAMSACYLKGVLRSQIELVQIFKGIMPYLGIVIFCMFLMYMFPSIALWLPDALFGPYEP